MSISPKHVIYKAVWAKSPHTPKSSAALNRKACSIWLHRQAKREPRSDIDLFVLVKGEAEKTIVERALEALNILCLKKFGNPLSPYLRTFAEMAALDQPKFEKEIRLGIVLE